MDQSCTGGDSAAAACGQATIGPPLSPVLGLCLTRTSVHALNCPASTPPTLCPVIVPGVLWSRSHARAGRCRSYHTQRRTQATRDGPRAAAATDRPARGAAHSIPARSAQRAQRTGHAATGGDGRCADPEAVPHSSATHKKGFAPLFPTTNTGSLTSISTTYPRPSRRVTVYGGGWCTGDVLPPMPTHRTRTHAHACVPSICMYKHALAHKHTTRAASMGLQTPARAHAHTTHTRTQTHLNAQTHASRIAGSPAHNIAKHHINDGASCAVSALYGEQGSPRSVSVLTDRDEGQQVAAAHATWNVHRATRGVRHAT
jgi:hypothetical protein